MKRKNLQPRIPYLAILLFRFDGEISRFPGNERKLRESSTTKPAGAAQACLLPSFPERLGLPTPLGARQLPPSPTFPSEARAPSPLGAMQLCEVSPAPLGGEEAEAHRAVVQAPLGDPASLWGPGLSLEPCSQPHSCGCPRRLGFSHPFVVWTFCRPGVTPGVRAAGWPPGLELQEALSSSPSASSARLSAACGLGPTHCSGISPLHLQVTGLCLRGLFSTPSPLCPLVPKPASSLQGSPSPWVPLVPHHLERPP